MPSSTEILKELESISPLLAKMEKKNVFSFPEGYFNTLTINILKNTASADIHKNELSVPEGYFENVSTAIIYKIKSIDDPSAELRNLSPLLYSIQNENVFNVPKDYFKRLEETLISTVAPPKAKVVKMKNNFVWRYAAAAILTGVIGISSLFVFNKSQKISDSDSTLTSYIQQAAQFKNESQINEGITTLSDDEIIKYLETTGNEADNEVLTQSIEEKGLPGQSDYLNNEQALQSYLNTIKD